jgi:hypothetical protein
MIASVNNLPAIIDRIPLEPDAEALWLTHAGWLRDNGLYDATPTAKRGGGANVLFLGTESLGAVR